MKIKVRNIFTKRISVDARPVRPKEIIETEKTPEVINLIKHNYLEVVKKERKLPKKAEDKVVVDADIQTPGDAKEVADKKLEEAKVLCDQCGTTKTEKTKDGKSDAIKHEVYCPVISPTNSTNTGN